MAWDKRVLSGGGRGIVPVSGPAVQLAREGLVRPAAQDHSFIEGDGRQPIGPGGDGGRKLFRFHHIIEHVKPSGGDGSGQFVGRLGPLPPTGHRRQGDPQQGGGKSS